jgi:hypothetical protein
MIQDTDITHADKTRAKTAEARYQKAFELAANFRTA